MEVQCCCMCVRGKCSEDCPTLDVLPYDETRPGIIRKAQKLQASGRDINAMKQELKDAGDVASKNELIDKWVHEFDSMPKGPLHEVIKNRAMIIKKQKLINEMSTANAHKQKVLETLTNVIKEARAFLENVKAADDSADDADKGLPGLKKCSTLLDEQGEED